jgi:hypothetical protein
MLSLVLYFKLTIQARSRTRSAFATARIGITRQINQLPFFVTTPYRRTITAVSQRLNDTIISVSARDNDLVVSLPLLF